MKDAISEQEKTITEQEFRTFIGDKADFYLGKWLAGNATSWNWAAFLLSGLWLGYRKMYKVAAIFFGIILFESFLEELFFVGFLGKDEAQAVLGFLVSLVAAWVCGTFGNTWYRNKAESNIRYVRSLRGSEEMKQDTLIKRGGTSYLASLLCLLLFLTGFFILMILYTTLPQGA